MKGEVLKTLVCNAAWFMDDQGNVMTDTCYDNTILAKGSSIPHIKDHEWEIDAQVGDVQAVYTKSLPLRTLGLNQEGETTCLLMDSLIKEVYNPTVFALYSDNKVTQHSIGLRYKQVKLAIDSQDEANAAEYANWLEYYPKILNKEVADARGFFLLVTELELIENSCVLFGANLLTPTLNSNNSLASNKSSQQPNTRGITMSEMTMESVLAKNVELSSALANANASLASAEQRGKQEEQTRILGILKSGTTFGIGANSIEKVILAGFTSEQATMNFEMAKEAAQAMATPNTAGTQSFGAVAGASAQATKLQGNTQWTKEFL
jgi:hypothetical protein